VKSPLRVGAVRAPKIKFPTRAERPETGKARRVASVSAVAAMVLGVGAASAFFVDYLADRALARAAETPVAAKPLVAKAVETSAETKVAALAPAPAPSQPSSQPVEPPKAEIAVVAPDPAAVAKVAVGPEHAIEVPTDDPTANPIIHADEISAPEDVASVDGSVLNEEPLEADGDADGTQTAAIDPAEPVIDQQPVKKPKRQKAVQAQAGQAKPQPAAKKTELASLPGVDVGGLAGNPSGDDNAASTVRTVTKQTKNLGGVPLGAARVTASVNMRSGPQKGAGVLGVVPAGSAVNVLSCNGWCQIAYNGRTGWVYKNYLAAASAQQKPAAKAASAAAPSTADPAAPAERKLKSSRL
jgi:hypothetical protein